LAIEKISRPAASRYEGSNINELDADAAERFQSNKITGTYYPRLIVFFAGKP
jgi:hypothetical protein